MIVYERQHICSRVVVHNVQGATFFCRSTSPLGGKAEQTKRRHHSKYGRREDPRVRSKTFQFTIMG
jgi:hypothetical protein